MIQHFIVSCLYRYDSAMQTFWVYFFFFFFVDAEVFFRARQSRTVLLEKGNEDFNQVPTTFRLLNFCVIVSQSIPDCNFLQWASP